MGRAYGHVNAGGVNAYYERPATIALPGEVTGFVIDRLVEPEPAPELREHDPEAAARLRTRPAFLFFRLAKRDCPQPGPAVQ